MTASDDAAAPTPAQEVAAGWRLEGGVAASADGSDAVIRLARPDRGIVIGRQQGGRQLLGLTVFDPGPPPEPAEGSAGLAPSDAWLRGRDVVAVYEPRDPRFLRVTAMWRRPPPGPEGIRSWELVASAQTSLPESDAALASVSIATARETHSLDEASGRWRRLDVSATTVVPTTAVIVRGPDGNSLLVTVHPSDARRVTVGPVRPGEADRARIECWLFPNAVEKGVLLRGRSLAAVGPSDGDTAWASSLVELFRRSPPVLTT